MITKITEITKMYGIDMDIKYGEKPSCEFDDDGFHFVVTENSPDEKYTHALGIVLFDEICKRWAQRMDDIMAFTLCSDEPVVAEIIGNLVFKNVYGYSPIDATKLFGPLDEVGADVDETVELVLYCIDIALKGVGN